MAVSGGLTRFARRYSAHPWASPLRGQRRRCSKTLPAFLSGQPARGLAVCPTGCASCRTPAGGSHPPAENIKEKSPYLRTGSHLKYGGEGGLTRFARPCGAARSRARGLSNWRCQLSNPSRGFSTPPVGATCEKKARTFVRALLKIWR